MIINIIILINFSALELIPTACQPCFSAILREANALTRRDATIYGLICGQLMLRQRAKERENGNEIECPNCITMHILQ